MSSTPRLSKELHEELGSAIRGQVYVRDDSDFVEYSSIFNGNVVCTAQAVACPLDAEDVSKIILFCSKHSLSPSVKAGGYGTGGWAIGGDIIIDVSKFIEIGIEAPLPGADHLASVAARRTRLSGGMIRLQSKLRIFCVGHIGQVGICPRQSVDASMSQFPRRRLGRALTPRDSGESDSASGESTPNVVVLHSPPSRPVVGGDPFGYLNTPTNFPAPLPPSVTQSAYNPRAGPDRWDPRPGGTLIANSNLPPVPLNLASQAEPIYPNAYVTFGAGMRQKEIDTFTANHQLEARSLSGPNTTIPYHIPFSAHPVGSGVMLLGGFGFLSRLHGLSIDSLVEVEMVTADGQILTVNENDHPDLWWALRGAGPALGVVTRYKAKAFPVPVVFAGNLLLGAPRELYANVLLTAGPEGKDSLIVVQMCYIGPKEKGQEYLLALSSWDGERCLLNEVHEKSFLHQQDSVAQVLRGKPGRQWFIRSALITSLPDEIINETVMQFADTPVGCTWLFELAGGAIVDFENNCVPKSQREASFTIAALHQWEMTIDDDRCIDSAEEWIAGSLKSVQSGGPFPSFLGRHEPAERTIGCYGNNWDRLVEVKKKYDPKNVFRNSLWPLDADLQRVDPRTHEPPTPHFLKSGH
ncbi:FAD-binding PCMH-type domain-containing protein [Mycena venus]|uniref:FAD-binding PCMH-type domain-containing protein n=1 Tax=Mycena venus TaxID=2733690 RepID=A0A8H6TZ21_9AGAR|nr:FAD-binding PCMH-type domain-containing protein [Mycena venus]